jgi:benzil reductase ((S)-benzoin forming)
LQKVAFITGSSKGIGKAISELLLSKNYIVFGYSRTNTIKHQNFKFVKINLSNLKETQEISFPKYNHAEVLLINNAATIGEIIPLHLKKEDDIMNEYNLNIVSPTLLCARLINSFKENRKIIINISSGASNSAIASWSTYCATKSALDRLTRVIAEEKHKNLTVFSVHPGIVDTQMQAEIRKADPNLFPLLSKFTTYYNNNKLEKAKNIAHKLLYIIQNHAKFAQNILSIRDINLN